MKDLYVVDTTKKKASVEIYDTETMIKDLKNFDKKNWRELEDFDFRIFNHAGKAQQFASDFNEALENLDNDEMCEDRRLPCLLYKRRYLVLTLLGIKNFTIRNYKKDWKVGQRFNLYDQTYFLTVKLKSITDLKNGFYQYDFES